MFILRTDVLRGDFFLCLFAEFIPRVSHPATDQAYGSLKKIAPSLKNRGVVCAVANLKMYQGIVRLAHGTQSPINSVPKLMFFGPNGMVIRVFSANTPKIPQEMVNFCLSNLPRQQPPSRGSRPDSRGRPQYVEDSDSDDDDDSERGPRSRSRSSGSRSQASQGYQPEFGTAPKMRGMLKGASYDQDDGEEFLIPEEVIPHNTPWDVDLD